MIPKDGAKRLSYASILIEMAATQEKNQANRIRHSCKE